MKIIAAALLLAVSTTTHALSLSEDIAVLEDITRTVLSNQPVDVVRLNAINEEITKRKQVLAFTGNRYVVVNISDQHIQAVENGKVIVREKVIIGKTQTPTPTFRSTIRSVIFNPQWNVPPDLAISFAKKMRVSGVWAGYYVEVDGIVVNTLKHLNPQSNVSMIQRPGKRNALGGVMFNMPNIHGVYVHDTPSKHLFKKSSRQYSAGCIRMQHPAKLASFLLGRTITTTKPMAEFTISEPVPVFVVNWSTVITEGGSVIHK